MPIAQFEGRALVFNNGVIDVKQGDTSLVDENKVAHIPEGNVLIDNETIIKNANDQLEIPIDEDTIYIDEHGFMKAKGGSSSEGIPTKLSELINDVGFITSEAIPDVSQFITSEDLPDVSHFVTSEALEEALPKNTSDLVNDSNFLSVPLPQDSEGKYIIENSDRLSNFLVSAGRKSANEYQFYVMPTSNEAILGCAGDIFTFDICIPAFTQPGNYSIDIQNVIFTDMQGNQIESEKPLCKQSDLIITDATMGDVNDDQYIDVYDVVAMVSYIMNSRSPHFNTLSADVTNDFVIDVIDLVKVVRMVMDGVLAGSNTSFFEQPTGSFSLRPANDDTIAIDIAGDDSYVASQFVVTLDEGQQLVNVTSDEQHTVTFEPLANNQYVVVCYSNTNQAFTTNKGIVSLHVTGSGSVDVENILLVNTAYEKVALQNGLPESADSINMLTLDPSCPSDIYSTTGVMVRKNATTTQGLKPGVYIVNGVKVFIK